MAAFSCIIRVIQLLILLQLLLQPGTYPLLPWGEEGKKMRLLLSTYINTEACAGDVDKTLHNDMDMKSTERSA